MNNAIAGERAAAGEEAAIQPVGEAQLRLAESVLAVHPAGEAIADERGIDFLEETLLGGGVLGDQGGGQARGVAVEESNRLAQVVHDLERHLGRLFPLPFAAQFFFGQAGALARPIGADPRFVAGGDVQFHARAARGAGLHQRGQEQRGQLRRTARAR